MSDDFSMFREAYDSRTGKKLPYLVPESHFDVFPHLRKTPTSMAATKQAAEGNTTDQAVKATKKGK